MSKLKHWTLKMLLRSMFFYERVITDADPEASFPTIEEAKGELKKVKEELWRRTA